MGFGLIANTKDLAPLLLYVVGVVLFFMTFGGKVRWTLAFVVFLIPLRNVIEKVQEFPVGTKFLTILIFVMALVTLVMRLQQRSKFMESSSLNIISFILIIYTFISLYLGSNRLHESILDVGSDRVQDWKNFCMMPMLFFITLNNVVDKKWVWRIFTVMCLSMVLMAYYTTSQIAWFSSLVSRAKISGTFQFLGPNEVAAFLDQYTLLMMSVYFFMKKGLNKRLLLGLILVNLYCILFMYSRGAYLATAVGMFILFSFKNKKLLVPLLLIAIFWNIALPEKARDRILETTNEYGDITDASVTRRLSIWTIAMDLFSENPVTGIGFGVFRTLGYDLQDTHNIYIKLLVEQGILGLLIFLIICMCLFKEGLKLYKKGDDDMSRGMGLGLFVCTAVMMINNFFGDRWAYFELSSYLWVYAGLVARLNAIADSLTPEQRAASRKSKLKKSPKYNV